MPDWTAEPVPLQPQEEPLCVCVADWLTGAVFVASADESAVFDCDTEPLLPGLSTRTEMFELLGWSCVADDRPSAPWLVSASCFDDCTPPLPPVWEALCVVVAEFVASAFEVASFDCVTLPSLPGLRTRTEMFELLGSTCLADEAATAVWSVDDPCVADWTPLPPDGAACVWVCVVGAVFVAAPFDAASLVCCDAAGSAACMAVPRTSPSEPEVTAGTTHPQPPARVWLELCVVVAVFVASALDVASFDCVTLPSLPGLSTRTEMFWFEGWIWVALEAAAAVWSVDDPWVDDWTGSASAFPHVAASTASATTSVVINRLMCEELL